MSDEALRRGIVGLRRTPEDNPGYERYGPGVLTEASRYDRGGESGIRHFCHTLVKLRVRKLDAEPGVYVLKNFRRFSGLPQLSRQTPTENILEGSRMRGLGDTSGVQTMLAGDSSAGDNLNQAAHDCQQ